MHEHFFGGLQLWHIQLDELKARPREKGHEVWVWVALDVQTMVIPAQAIGPRTQALAHALIHGLCEAWTAGCVPASRAIG